MKAAITSLAGRAWQHPTTGDPIQFGFTTIERWYYRALKERADPVGVVRRKPSLPRGIKGDGGTRLAPPSANPSESPGP
jgi:hypothetical protein